MHIKSKYGTSYLDRAGHIEHDVTAGGKTSLQKGKYSWRLKRDKTMYSLLSAKSFNNRENGIGNKPAILSFAFTSLTLGDLVTVDLV
jgi:hypothetical protein